MTTILTLFVSGVLTILLPCILPLVPIVLGVSLTGQRRARPLAITLGMVASFVASTFLLQVVFRHLVQLADVVRMANYYVLLLFGICFLVERRWLRIGLAAAAAGLIFFGAGAWAVAGAALLGSGAVMLGGYVAARLQTLGAQAQQGGSRESLLSAFIVGLTLGLVWAPCAGPALGFALTLVRDEPGARALASLTAYALGAAMPLLIIGYGGQRVLRRVGWLARRSGFAKVGAGVVLVATALALHSHALARLQTWLDGRTGLGAVAARLESSLVDKALAAPAASPTSAPAATHQMAAAASDLPKLPNLGPAPELTGLGPWYNSAPLTLASLRGKVVLVDFWTYSCINCLRTLPALRALWGKYHEQPFVIIGVHAPEFAFEGNPANVAAAIKRHQLTYPIAQDNDFLTWKAFSNHYWPAKYLIDAQGNLRYTHFGEGGEEATELAIRSLLAEAGHATPAPGSAMQPAAHARRMSPETYVGERGWDAFANKLGAPDAKPHRYRAPKSLDVDQFALVGDWQLADNERQVLRSSTGEIRFHAVGDEVNLVLGTEPGAQPVTADVLVDGRESKQLTIDRHDLYNLYSGRYGEHEIVLRLHRAQAAAYAFTFGG